MSAAEALNGPPEPPAAAVRARLGFRRTKPYEIGSDRIMLAELTALDASTIWGDLGTAESEGRMMDAYIRLVLAGAYTPSGDRLFATLEEVQALPARIVVPMAEAIMALTDMELDSGNVDAPAET